MDHSYSIINCSNESVCPRIYLVYNSFYPCSYVWSGFISRKLHSIVYDWFLSLSIEYSSLHLIRRSNTRVCFCKRDFTVDEVIQPNSDYILSTYDFRRNELFILLKDFLGIDLTK